MCKLSLRKNKLRLHMNVCVCVQEHPFLGQPFFMLHPCHTEDFMGPLVKMAHAKKR